VFTSGYVVPKLLPFDKVPNNQWGQPDHKVRGICYHLQEKFGFMRYMDESFQYKEAFFHVSAVKGKHKPALEHIYEFTLKTSNKGMQAEEIKMIS
jgi:cold shock CspA family protein